MQIENRNMEIRLKKQFAFLYFLSIEYLVHSCFYTTFLSTEPEKI